MVSNFKYMLIYLYINKTILNIKHWRFNYDMIYGVYVMTFQSDEALIPDY